MAFIPFFFLFARIFRQSIDILGKIGHLGIEEFRMQKIPLHDLKGGCIIVAIANTLIENRAEGDIVPSLCRAILRKCSFRVFLSVGKIHR